MDNRDRSVFRDFLEWLCDVRKVVGAVGIGFRLFVVENKSELECVRGTSCRGGGSARRGGGAAQCCRRH